MSLPHPRGVVPIDMDLLVQKVSALNHQGHQPTHKPGHHVRFADTGESGNFDSEEIPTVKDSHSPVAEPLLEDLPIPIQGEEVSSSITVALLNRAEEMRELVQRNQSLFSTIRSVLRGHHSAVPLSPTSPGVSRNTSEKFEQLLYTPRGVMSDNVWMAKLAQFLEPTPHLWAVFQEVVGYEPAEWETAHISFGKPAIRVKEEKHVQILPPRSPTSPKITAGEASRTGNVPNLVGTTPNVLRDFPTDHTTDSSDHPRLNSKSGNRRGSLTVSPLADAFHDKEPDLMDNSTFPARPDTLSALQRRRQSLPVNTFSATNPGGNHGTLSNLADDGYEFITYPEPAASSPVYPPTSREPVQPGQVPSAVPSLHSALLLLRRHPPAMKDIVSIYQLFFSNLKKRFDDSTYRASVVGTVSQFPDTMGTSHCDQEQAHERSGKNQYQTFCRVLLASPNEVEDGVWCYTLLRTLQQWPDLLDEFRQIIMCEADRLAVQRRSSLPV
ncbi:hypothetical protein IWQ61_005597 [Dispira simplex]|nr:hypothetical protein IWQ61_005597 [Dispira simplex]